MAVVWLFVLLVTISAQKYSQQGSSGPHLRNSDLGGPDLVGEGRDQEVIQQLVQNRDKIERHVTRTETGVEARTWSDDETVASLIKEHVHAMKQRVENEDPIRQGDPLFKTVFDNLDSLELSVVNETNGVLVSENGTNDCGEALVHAHSDVVTAFIKHGANETRAKHDVPETCNQTSGAPTRTVSRLLIVMLVLTLNLLSAN
mmetsp:Transcript_31106/g.73943  ORF Transcript_31106/g.73943 Transcript_31106/m.73943 type:complete len:202 (+) Transcript_31106:96-701(+)